MLLTNRFQAVEIPIPSGSTLTQFNFPDLPQLTGQNGYPVIINAIEIYNSDTISASPVSGSTVASKTDIDKSFLTLYQGDLQTILNIPLNILNRVQATNNPHPFVRQPFMLNLENVSWTKSYVSLASAATNTGRVFAFGIHYSVGY